MAIALRAVGTRNAATPGVPAGTTTDDIVVLVAHGQLNAVGNGPTCTGFTLASLATSGGGGVGRYTAILWKRATGNESGTYPMAIGGTSNIAMTEAYSFTGVVKSGTPWALENSAFLASLNTSTAPVSLTGVPAGSYLFWGVGSNGATATVTAPGGWTEISPTTTSTLHVIGQTAAAANTGSLSMTMSGTSTNKSAAIIALIPDSPATAVASTATISSDGTKGTATNSSDVGAVAAFTTVGVTGMAGVAAVAATAAIVAAGAVGIGTGATQTGVATIAASGSVGRSTGASIAAAAPITTGGTKGVAGTAGLAATATITTTGAVTTPPNSPASVGVTAAITTAGVVGRTTTASLPATATIVTAGQLGRAASATLSVVVNIAATGASGASGASGQAVTASIAATGEVAIPSTNDVTVLSVVEVSRVVLFNPASAGTPYGAGTYGSGTYGSSAPPRTVTVTEIIRPVRIENVP